MQNDGMATLELPESLAPVLDAVAAVSEPYDGVYLVGGSVRDILLGERNFDVDIVVEGDAIALARDLAEKLEGRVRTHRTFGTAVVLYDEDGRVDVVTARSESYHAPAVLPAVEPGTIDEDLHRRDFTINAMAVSLKGDAVGELVDPFGGRADLEAGRIRVLHDRSFIDDPTRILRAIRYEDRYGFRMDDQTVRLARECIATGHVGDLSGARLRDELIALLEEGDVSHAIPRLAELGAQKEIHPHVVADDEAVRLFDRLRELNARYGLRVPAWRLGLEALARKLPHDEIGPWLHGLKVRRRDAEQIRAAIEDGPRIAEQLGRDSLAPADVVALAEPRAPDAPLFALALADSPQLHEYFDRLGGIKLEITGADVAELGLGESPRVGEILAEVRRRKLNGELEGRESELEAARELVEQS
jgi:tRNA nucleotidyltransferase (CCA-adding enzyme)